LFQRRIVRFAAVGAVSTTADIILYQLLYSMHVYVQVAATLGFLAGLSVGFILNSRFVFKTELTTHRYGRYALTSFGGLLITNGLIYLLYTDAQLTTALVAKLIAVMVVFVWNYTWSRYWAFT
jgi:putative flippase GtrA